MLPIYDDFMPRKLRKFLYGKPPTVLHRETCPVCGKRLANLYRHGKEWLCRTCKIAAEKVDAEVEE